MPAVSIMSSIITTVLLLTSPITFSTFVMPGFDLLLSTMAIGACNTPATCLARAAPPTSGATNTTSLSWMLWRVVQESPGRRIYADIMFSNGSVH